MSHLSFTFNILKPRECQGNTGQADYRGVTSLEIVLICLSGILETTAIIPEFLIWFTSSETEKSVLGQLGLQYYPQCQCMHVFVKGNQMGNCIGERVIKYGQKAKNNCWRAEEDGSIEMDMKGSGGNYELSAWFLIVLHNIWINGTIFANTIHVK